MKKIYNLTKKNVAIGEIDLDYYRTFAYIFILIPNYYWNRANNSTKKDKTL